MARHLDVGKRGEAAAAERLQADGYRILDRNWRSRQLELDLVAEKDGVLVFVEVKTRAADALATPEDALGTVKQNRLVRAAALYLSEHGRWDAPCRFDLMAVSVHPDGRLDLTHVEDAFDHTASLGSPNQPWQPW